MFRMIHNSHVLIYMKFFLKNRFFGKRCDHILQYHNKHYHGNVHNEDIIHITSSSTFIENYKVEHIVEQNDDKYSEDQADQCIKFDF